jgi:hypothetical protein
MTNCVREKDMTLPICLSVGMLENDHFKKQDLKLNSTVSNVMTNLKESNETAGLSVRTLENDIVTLSLFVNV